MKRSFMRQPNDCKLRLQAGPRRGACSVSGKALPRRRLPQSLEADFDVVIHYHGGVIGEAC